MKNINIIMPFIRFQMASPLGALCSFGLHNSLRVLQVKNYSVFPPTYVPPVYHPEEVKNLDEEQKRILLHKNILPPRSNQNASVFHDPILEKFVNRVMKHGRKEKARQIIRDAFEKVKRIQVRKFHLEKNEELKEKICTDPIEIFHRAFANCQPVLEVTPVKKGGSIYKVPVALPERKAHFLAFKWLVEVSREQEPRRKHTGEFFSDRLAKELLDASQNTGKSVAKKIELHKLCEANKAYAHYRWG